MRRAALAGAGAAPDVPEAVRDIAAVFATARGKRKARAIPLNDLAIGRCRRARVVEDARHDPGDRQEEVGGQGLEGTWRTDAIRLTAEFPDGLDAAGRRAITQAICDRLDSAGIMYVAAIHAPDHHNDHRNHHLHLACHDRPARKIWDRWDFTIAETVAGQHGRVRYPYAQKKVVEWSRDSDGGNHRDYGTTMVSDMRTFFADRCNEELDRLGVTRKFHPGTLRSLGCERDGQKPLGTRAAPLEAVGVPTSKGIDNAELLWSALLREAWTAAEERAQARTALRRRLAEAERRFAEGTAIDQAHVAAIRDLTTRLDAADAVLRQHDAECAEYDVTLAMARARPDKTITVCRRILKAIGEGKADSAEQRANAAIAARPTRPRRSSPASLPSSAIMPGAGQIPDGGHDGPGGGRGDRGCRNAADRTPCTGSHTRASPSGPAATLEALFVRIMTDDMPILPPDGTVAGYRVPGVTRAECNALNTPALAEMAQKRLAALADMQAKRMTAAASTLHRSARTA